MMMGSSLLSAVPGLRHAFFTCEGGVSEGIYASLNGGLGSNDDKTRVIENRRRMAEQLGVDAGKPSRRTSDPFARCDRGDRRRGRAARGPRPMPSSPAPRALAIGVTTADCGPILLVDPSARVIGAAHAGWKGALTGILESTVDAMEKLGADRGGIVAAIGPLIRQPSYEVGSEFVERFLDADADNVRFFLPGERAGHSMFDLAGYIRMRLENAGVLMIDDIGVDTYADERFYSYRRSVHRNEPDYGRLVHAIALERE